MKWLSFRAQLIAFVLSCDVIGLSAETLTAFCARNPAGFEVERRFGSEMDNGRFACWRNQVSSDWPGNYANLSMRQSEDGSRVHISFHATPDNKAYPSGLDFVSQLLDLPHSAIQNIQFELEGDGFSANMTRDLSEHELRLLLGNVKVEMDETMDKPWTHSAISFSLECQSDVLFLRRLDAVD